MRKYHISGTFEVSEPLDPVPPDCEVGRKMIMKAGANGHAVSTGPLQVLQNIQSGQWTAEQVQEYDYCEMQYFQRLAMSDPPEVYDAVAQLKQIADIKVLSLVRPDIAWYGPNVDYVDPSIAWGSSALGRPTKAMGEKPKIAKSWVRAQSELRRAGYFQNAINADKTGSNSLTNPYQLGLDAANKEWFVRTHQMDVTNEDWRQLKTDAWCLWHDTFPNVDGVIIAPTKHNFAAQGTGFHDIKQFHLWLEGFNSGWNLRTNSGGQLQDSWGNSSGWQSVYDNKSATVRDIFEDGWETARLLKQKRPEMLIGYDTHYLGVPLNVTAARFIDEYVADTGKTEEEALTYFIDRHFEMAELCDMFMFPAETGVVGGSIDNIWEYCPIPEEQRNELRDITCQGRGLWCSYPPTPFTP